jgi:hypothetical protein
MTEHAAGTAGGTPPPAVSAAPGRPQAKVYLEQLATLTGLPYETVRAYHNRAMQRRRAEAEGRPWKHLSGDTLPEPDGWDPNPLSPRPKPYWYRVTLRPWLATRQRGGGRPRASGQPAQPRKKHPRTPGPKPGMHRYAGQRPAAPPATGDPPVTGDPRD